jgi:hypothetical protein
MWTHLICGYNASIDINRFHAYQLDCSALHAACPDQVKDAPRGPGIVSRVSEAMMQMEKIDIAALEAAAAKEPRHG